MNVAIHWLAEWPSRASHFEMFVSGGKKGSFSLNENNQTTTAFASTNYDSQHWQGLPIIHQTNTGMKWKPETFQIIWWDSSAQKRSQDVSIYICCTCFMTLSNLSLIVIPNFSQLGCDCSHNTKRCRTAHPVINLKGHHDIGFPAHGGGGGGGGGRRESMPSFFNLVKSKISLTHLERLDHHPWVIMKGWKGQTHSLTAVACCRAAVFPHWLLAYRAEMMIYLHFCLRQINPRV